MRSPTGSNGVFLRCPKCHKRLAAVTALRAESGAVVGISDQTPTRAVVRGDAIIPRAGDARWRAPGQPGPLSGYHEPQARTDDIRRLFSPPVWSWRCPCGARPRVRYETLCRLVADALAAGEHHVTVP
jgi:hypothetical protein